MPFVDGEAAALVLRHKVFRLLQREGLLSEERTRLLLSWRHSGFSVHTSVTVPPDDRDGLDTTAAACLGELPLPLLLALAVGKILATALTLGSRGWGGDPALFVGAMLGGGDGRGLEALLGPAIARVGAYAMVGMGGVLAAIVRCPATSVLLLFEMTSSYQVILPIMCVSRPPPWSPDVSTRWACTTSGCSNTSLFET